jgi:hypothetical protein
VDDGGERPAGRDALGAVLVPERQGGARLADADQVDLDLRGPCVTFSQPNEVVLSARAQFTLP